MLTKPKLFTISQIIVCTEQVNKFETKFSYSLFVLRLVEETLRAAPPAKPCFHNVEDITHHNQAVWGEERWSCGWLKGRGRRRRLANYEWVSWEPVCYKQGSHRNLLCRQTKVAPRRSGGFLSGKIHFSRENIIYLIANQPHIYGIKLGKGKLVSDSFSPAPHLIKTIRHKKFS